MSPSDKMSLGIALRENDYGWEERKTPERKVILTNPQDVKDAELLNYVSAFRGTGHSEWEFLMGAWMIESVGKALETGEECDITIVFNTEFLARPKKKGEDYRRFTKKQVYDHIIKCFTIVEDSKDVLKLAVKVRQGKKDKDPDA